MALPLHSARYLRTLRCQRRPVRFLAGRILRATGLCHPFVVDCGAFRLRFFPTSLSVKYWVEPDRSSRDRRFFETFLRQGDRVVDVGANIGVLTLTAAAAVGPEGSVLAVEAHPRIARYLRHNVDLNGFGNIEVIEAAVGAERGEAFISDRRSDVCNEVVGEGGHAVAVLPLDEIAGPDPIDLLKVDVEGYERFVFQGAPDTLSRTESVFFECWDEHLAKHGQRAAELIELLRDAGFEVYELDKAVRESVPPDLAAPLNMNLVATRDPAALATRLGV